MSRARRLSSIGFNDAIRMDASAADTDVNDFLLLDRTTNSESFGRNNIDADSGFRILMEDNGSDVPYDSQAGHEVSTEENHVAFKVALSSNQSISHNTTTKINFDRVIYDNNGNANMIDDPSKFTCPKSGIYYVNINLYQLASSAAAMMFYMHAYLYSNRGSKSSVDRVWNAVYEQPTYGGGYDNTHPAFYDGSRIINNVIHIKKGDEFEVSTYLYRVGASFTSYADFNYDYDGWEMALIRPMPD